MVKKRRLPKELTTVTKVSKTIALIMFICLPIIGFLYGMQYQQVLDSTQFMQQVQPYHAKSVKTVIPSITSSTQYNGDDYQAGVEIDDAKFSLNYPNGWRVSIKKDPGFMSFKRFEISVIPPDVKLNQGENFWGGFIVDAYPPQSSIEKWFTNFLSTPINGMNMEDNNRSYYTYNTSEIGNKTAYLIQTSNSAPQFVHIGFEPREIILGEYYSYQIGFFQNGDSGFSKLIENELFPTLNFQ